MNYLAHTFLSCKNELLLVGNFLGDFVKNKDLPAFDPTIQEGIRLHRKIDTYTDQHPLVIQGMRRMYPDHGKYAAILIDVFYDHFLAINWDQFHSDSLNDFTKQVYRILDKHLSSMPPKMLNIVPRMIADDWLFRYQSLQGMERTLFFLQKRVSQPKKIQGAIDTLKRDFDLLNEEFIAFFPQVIEYVETECIC